MRFHALAVCLLVVLGACSGKGSLEFPDLLDPAPFAAQADGRIDTGSGLDAVPVGKPVTLSWLGAPGIFEWTLTTPPGSLATLSGGATASPSFTPDVEGDYAVSVTVFPAGAGPEMERRRITAASYLGLSACARCHIDRAADHGGTNHAATVMNDGATLFGMPGCTTCHTLDPVPLPATPASGGFSDEAASRGFDPATYTTYAAFSSGFPTVADRASVQCENCHGPGSRHDGDPRRIGRTLRAELCGGCHNGTVGPNRLAQWQNSGHGGTPPPGTTTDVSCVRCHTAEGYLAFWSGQAATAQPPGAPPITCAVCHDPHRAANPGQMRVVGTVDLASGGSYVAGAAAACFRCHQGEVADPVAQADSGGTFPCSVQGDMMATRGAVEYGLSVSASYHATTVFRLRSSTGNPADSDQPDSCVVCHVAEGPTDDLGGHSMIQRQGTTEFAAGNCDRCHPGLDTFDRRISADFDGDGTAFGVQSEVRSLMEILFDAIRVADTGLAVSRPGGALTPATLSPDLTRSTPALRRAVYNYNFVVTDGSSGIHNTAYTVQILQRTYGELTGVPFHTAFPDAALR